MIATVLSACLALTTLTADQRVFYAGGDPSEIPEVEARGGVYTLHHAKIDPLVAMKQAGWTAIRLRLWNDPRAHFCDLAHTMAMAKRAHDAGLRVMLDFHYSDWWADPQKQNKPAAWKDLNFKDLEKALHDYSRDVVKALADQGTPADVVQPGNEITNGMLWPDGKIEINNNGWPQLIELLKSAIAGIKEGGGANPPRIMIHLDQGGQNDVSRLWLDNFFKRGGDLDIIGLSYYPQWHGTMEELRANLRDLAKRYKKDVLVAETSFPYMANTFNRGPASPVPGIPATPDGQAIYLHRLVDILRSTPDHRGIGVLWWAPAIVSPPGGRGFASPMSLFDRTGEALPAFFAFGKH